MIEGLALHADQLVIAALQGEKRGGVLVKVNHAAEGVGLADHPQRAPVGQIPPILARIESGVDPEPTGFPVAIIGVLGQAALLAQTVENLAVAGTGGKKARIQRP